MVRGRAGTHVTAKELAPRFEGFASSSLEASEIKKRVKRYDTIPEVRLRQALFANGLRYRLHALHLPGRPDVIFPAARVAVFCDGDFWHGRNWSSRRRKLSQGANASYWIAKIRANMRRDRRNRRQLEIMGWSVIRIWESEIVQDPNKQAQIVLRLVRKRSRPPSALAARQ